LNLGIWGDPKTSKKRCEKGRAKIEAHGAKSSGLNLNPLAPAQSKHTFPFSGKTPNSVQNASIPAPFFCSFLHLFLAFS